MWPRSCRTEWEVSEQWKYVVDRLHGNQVKGLFRLQNTVKETNRRLKTVYMYYAYACNIAFLHTITIFNSLPRILQLIDHELDILMSRTTEPLSKMINTTYSENGLNFTCLHQQILRRVGLWGNNKWLMEKKRDSKW